MVDARGRRGGRGPALRRRRPQDALKGSCPEPGLALGAGRGGRRRASPVPGSAAGRGAGGPVAGPGLRGAQATRSRPAGDARPCPESAPAQPRRGRPSWGAAEARGCGAGGVARTTGPGNSDRPDAAGTSRRGGGGGPAPGASLGPRTGTASRDGAGLRDPTEGAVGRLSSESHLGGTAPEDVGQEPA